MRNNSLCETISQSKTKSVQPFKKFMREACRVLMRCNIFHAKLTFPKIVVRCLCEGKPCRQINFVS